MIYVPCDGSNVLLLFFYFLSRDMILSQEGNSKEELIGEWTKFTTIVENCVQRRV